jgi:hypothetical protein
MRHTSRFTSPPVIGQFAEGTSEGPTKGGPPYSTSWSGIYGGIRPSEFTGGEPVHFFRNGLVGDTPQGRFGLPVSQFTTSACPVCGGVLESRGPFDGTQASSGVTGGHEGFGETFLCPDGHWFTQIQGATVPAERILTVIEPVGTDEAYKDAPAEAKPFVVCDSKGVPVGGQTPELGRFSTEQEAAEFISTLPEPLTGRYSLDGPADDYTEEDNPVFGGYTREQLSAAFNLVKNPENWKLPVDAVISAGVSTDLVSSAIAFFAGCPAEFQPAPEGGFRVTAAGYYACIGS